MSLRRLRDAGMRERTLHNEPEWTRPLDWPAIPSVAHNEQVFYGLAAIFDSTSNLVTLKVAGNYTVDWGDGGATENVSSGVAALHSYSWSAGGLSAATADGFKLALVKVIPNGGNITSIDLSEKPSGVTYDYPSRWVEVFINAPNMASLRVYEDTAGDTGSGSHDTLFVFGLRQHSITDLSFLLADTKVKRLSEFVTSGVTALAYTFYSLYRLESMPLLDTSSATNMEGTFSECQKLKAINLTDTSLVETFAWCFYGCNLLNKFPVIDTSSATVLMGMCAGLLFSEFPVFNTSACNDFSYLFEGCSWLVEAPLLDTSSGTNFSDMFNQCNSLARVPNYDFSSALNTQHMFQYCTSFLSVSDLSLPAATNVFGMFSNCAELCYVDNIDMGAATNAGEVFSSCHALSYIGVMDLSSATDLTSFVYYTLPITRCKATGIKSTISFYGSKLNAAELDELYTNLATVVGKTITVTGNPGVSGDTPSIATAKGWTVVG